MGVCVSSTKKAEVAIRGSAVSLCQLPFSAKCLPSVYKMLTLGIHFQDTIIVSGFEKRGHFGPALNLEILISSENIGNQLSFPASSMFIAAWIHFLYAFI